MKLDLLPERDTDLFEVAINTIITLSQYYDRYKQNRCYRKHEQSPPRIKIAATITVLIEEEDFAESMEQQRSQRLMSGHSSTGILWLHTISFLRENKVNSCVLNIVYLILVL